MRAVTLTSPGHFALDEHPAPPLAAGLVRVAMRAAGVCSSDIARAHGAAYHHPLVLGHELAGVVLAHGAEVTGAPTLGVPVTIFPLLPCFSCGPCAHEEYARCRDYDYLGSRRDGGFATHVDAPAWNLMPLPDGVSLADGALTEPLAVVVHALGRLGLEPGSAAAGPLAILGAGFLGLLAVAVLRVTHPGLAVTVLGRHPDKLARAAALGAATVGPDTHADVADASFPLVLEAAGAPATFAASVRLAAPGGAVVWMGNPSGDVTLPRGLASQVLRKELTVRGTWNSTYRGASPSDWTRALALMAGTDGAPVRPTRFVTRTVDLAGVPGLLADLHAAKHSGGSTELKALVRIAETAS